ncbi:MAG TPA: AAA family ATPase [Candidatus Dormibacteraeota bacterium]|jgi:cell division protease FtsH|nr:AAA family ATPase [Candidatus Dormibacteraeota bacterium]
MSKVWRRIRRPLTWVFAIAAVFYLVIIFFAWLGVSFSGPGGPSQQINPAEATRNFGNVAGGVLRTYVFFVIQFITLPFIIVAQFAFLFWFLARGTTYTIFPGEYDVGFDDVRGQDHIVRSTREVMRVFQGYKDFRKLGGHPPRGVLFEGPPGTGKTLLAKAIAGETGVPFMYASGAGFANMFLGIPQLKVRSTFKKARRYSDRWGGCVIFIDELDSIGGSRSGNTNAGGRSAGGGLGTIVGRYVMPGGMGGGGMNLVNALLTEIDGVDKPPRMQRFLRRHLRLPPRTVDRHNLLIIGATNMASTLDAALVRPGRFDRKMHVGIPSRDGRRDIIAYYLSKVTHEPVDLERIARLTQGYSPAALRNLVNEALILALQDGRDALNWDDLWRAYLTNDAGLAEQVTYSPNVKAATAIHEAGHAMACHFLASHRTVTIITVRKRAGALGMAYGHLEDETFGAKRSEMLGNIKFYLAGMVAEEIWLGETSTGPGSDLEAATQHVLHMIANLAMGEENMLSLGVLSGRSLIEDDVSAALRDPRLRDEANRILHECKDEVRRLLLDKRVAMEAVRDALVEHDEISGDEFRAILYEVGAITEPPRSMRPLPIVRQV